MNIPPEPCEVWIDEPAPTLVAEFQTSFGYAIRNKPMTVEDFDSDRFSSLQRLIDEEYQELLDAIKDRNMIDYIDALQDLKYVIYGLELRMGISSEEHFAAVHDANMRKLGPDGKPIHREDGKILKPEGWEGPDADHKAILERITDEGFIYG